MNLQPAHPLTTAEIATLRAADELRIQAGDATFAAMFFSNYPNQGDETAARGLAATLRRRAYELEGPVYQASAERAQLRTAGSNP